MIDNKRSKRLKSLLYTVLGIGLVIGLWQMMALLLDQPVIFPSAASILSALWQGLTDGSLLLRTGYSLRLILIGMGLSVLLAVLFSLLSMLFRPFAKLSHILISALDPLPGIALLPVAILWFDLGEKPLLFVMVHSILWPMLLNILNGFASVPVIYDEVGRSIGLRGFHLIRSVYVPASIPSILAGFRTGWSRAWRALLSSEMVYGVIGNRGGLGWDIYSKKVYLDMPGMFATLIVIMLIGIFIEKALFDNIERVTVKKWGMRI